MLSREQAKISSMTLGRHGFKGVKMGGQALEQVQVTTDIVRRAVSSLEHARLLKSRVEQVSIPLLRFSAVLMGTYQIGGTLAACWRFHCVCKK